MKIFMQTHGETVKGLMGLASLSVAEISGALWEAQANKDKSINHFISIPLIYP
jgi:hypothetical protein